MKKLIIILFAFLLSASMSFGQGITFGLDDIDVSALNPGDDVVVPVYMNYMEPGYTCIGFDLFIGFDHGFLTWKGTSPAPLTGVQNFHPLLTYSPSDWLFNDNGTEMIVTWQDPTYLGIPFGDGDVLFEYVFTYNGGLDGTSPMVWGTSNKTQGTENILQIKGITAAFHNFFGSFVVSLVDGSIFATAGTTEWTGAVSGDWADPLNWTMGVPADGADVTITTAYTFAPVIAGSVTTGALTVEAGAMLTVEPLGDLTTNGLFTCDGDFYIMTENGSGYSGSFIDLGGLAGGGMFYFTRNMLCTGISQYSADPLGWHYLAAPIDGFSTWDLFDYYVNAWDETTSMWMHVEGMSPNCTSPGPNVPLGAMEAWSINYAADYSCEATYPGTGLDLEFMGAFVDIHTGGYSAGATFSGGAWSGWNLFGNPYPSGLDMNAIAWDPAAVPGAAYYDGCAGNYVYWTPALGAYSMSPGLGFFTEWTAPGTFALTGAERAHGADWFWKDGVSNLVTLEITGETGSDITNIRFMDEAEAGFAKDGDFHKLFSTAVPQIYTTAGDDKLAVNALPETAMVPMGLTSEVSGSYTISAIETSNFANVVLEDRMTGEQTDLLTSSYTFEYTVGDDADRFFVHFTPLGSSDLSANSVSIWSNEQSIVVDSPADMTGTVVVYNMMGQEVVSAEMEPMRTVIPMNDVNTYYVVKVLTSDNAVTGKVYIK